MPTAQELWNPYTFLLPAIAGSPTLQRSFAENQAPLQKAFSPPAFSQAPQFYPSKMGTWNFDQAIMAPAAPDYGGFKPIPIPQTSLRSSGGSSGGLLNSLIPTLSTLGLVNSLLGNPFGSLIKAGIDKITGTTQQSGQQPGSGARLGKPVSEDVSPAASAIARLVDQGVSQSTAELIVNSIDPKLLAAEVDLSQVGQIGETIFPNVAPGEFEQLAQNAINQTGRFAPPIDTALSTPAEGLNLATGGIASIASALSPTAEAASPLALESVFGSTAPTAEAAGFSLPFLGSGLGAGLTLGAIPFGIGALFAKLFGGGHDWDKAEKKRVAGWINEIKTDPSGWSARWKARVPPELATLADEALTGKLTHDRLNQVLGVPAGDWPSPLGNDSGGWLSNGLIHPVFLEDNLSNLSNWFQSRKEHLEGLTRSAGLPSGFEHAVDRDAQGKQVFRKDSQGNDIFVKEDSETGRPIFFIRDDEGQFHVIPQNDLNQD